MSKAPVIRQTAWSAALIHLVLLAALTLTLLSVTSLTFSLALLIAVAVFIGYRLLARAFLARDHVAGMKAVKAGDFDAAISHFERSRIFFEDHPWLDRGRHALILASSPMPYREMALCNIAFCLSQAGRGEQARIAYEHALAEYPDSALAQAGLRMAKSFETSSHEKEA